MSKNEKKIKVKQVAEIVMAPSEPQKPLEAKLKLSMIPVDQLHKWDKNPRNIKAVDFEKLKRSLEKNPGFMQKRPLLVNETKGKYVVYAGNMRLAAIKALGWPEAPCIVEKDIPTKRMNEEALKDNIEYGQWDMDLMSENFSEEELKEMELPELEMWLFELNNDDINNEAEEDDYQMPDYIKTDIVPGDLFEIWEHRLLCGDSTDADQVALLMNGEKAEIAFTSPPYNAGTTPTEVKMGKSSKYANDDDNKSEEDYLELLLSFTKNTLLFSEYSFVNIQSLSGNKVALIDFLYNMKLYYADTLIWEKGNAQPAMANNVLNSQYEYIHCFSKKANRAIGTKEFRWTLSNVIQISKQSSNKVKEHNATFPIDFASFFVKNFCNKSVLDLFLGSWTTMVASHQLKRKCYGMELDPKYCQVIVDRMKLLDPDIIIKRNWDIWEI